MCSDFVAQQHTVLTHTGEYTMSKTPYEIRLELLQLAREILSQPIYEEVNARKEKWHSLSEDTRDTTEYPTMPTFPSSTEIINKAEELNKFVSGY